ncbi:HWE histidine kinase domain-containing protein [Litorisediminicola beolgyonensis]|uniref:histidine kinase n=1 Tax=Litorisediminicola beolgyonensis TaxID=1173614 RepID=A0ABW3ZCR7_9RHOB
MTKTDWRDRKGLDGPMAYAVAFALAVIAVVLSVLLVPRIGDAVPFALFPPFLILIGLLCGPLPSTLAFGGIMIAGWALLLPESGNLERQILQTGFAVLSGGSILILTLALRSSVLGAQSARRLAQSLEREAETQRALAQTKAEELELLSRELTHRNANLFGVISSIVSISGRGKTDVPQVVSDIRSRIRALSQAHLVATSPTPGVDGLLNAVVSTVLAPYRHENGIERVSVSGPDVELDHQARTSLGLILHELATNALKYGALAAPDGTVSVTWDAASNVTLTWHETGGAPPTATSRESGQGSLVIDASVAQLGGEIRRDWAPEGLRVTLVFPNGSRYLPRR